MHGSSQARYVIVNADDFGLTDGINRGIIDAHERGIVTSASLMVRYPAAVRAAELAQTHPNLSVGLHFDIAEWRYHNGQWEAAYQVVNANDAAAVEGELQRQLATFKSLMGRGPTHLDSHQHIHKSTPALEIMVRASEALGVPLRSCDAGIRYAGSFYGQTAEGDPFPDGITSTRLTEMIDNLEPGWTEIGCHPGYADGLDSVYLSEREAELRVLRNAEIRAALGRNEISLASFRDFADRMHCRAPSSPAGDAQRI